MPIFQNFFLLGPFAFSTLFGPFVTIYFLHTIWSTIYYHFPSPPPIWSTIYYHSPPPFHLVHHLLPFPLATQIGHLLQPGWYQIYLFNLVISQDSDGENTGQSPDEGGEGELDLAVSTSPEIGTKRTKGRSKSKVTISTGDSDNELPGT